MLPAEANPFGPPKLAALLIAATLAAAAVALAPVARTRLRRVLATPVGLALGAVALLGGTSLAVSVDRWRSLLGSYPEYRGALAMAASVVVALAVASMPEDRARRDIGRTLAVAVLAVSLYAVAQRFGLDPVRFRAGLDLARARATLGNASNLAVWLVLATPLVVDRALAETGRWRAAALAAAALAVVAVALTASRGGWLGAGAACVVGLALAVRGRDRSRQLRVWGRAAAVALAVALAVAVLVPGAASRAASIARPHAGTAGWRLEVWGSALHATAARPLLGWGPSAFELVYPAYATEAAVRATRTTAVLTDAHNVVLNAAATLGVPAVLAALLGLGLLLFGLWRSSLRSGSEPALAASLVGGFVALQFHALTLDTGPLLLAVVALALAAIAPAEDAHAADARSRLPEALAWAVAGLFALATLGAATLVVADVRALPSAPADLAAASRIAPFEPAFAEARARAAAQADDASVRASALAAVRTAESRSPLDARLRIAEGDLLLVGAVDSGQPDAFARAREVYEVALGADPLSPEANLGRGAALLGEGRAVEAEAALQRATYLAPWMPEAWGNLAEAARQAGDDAVAAEAERRAGSVAR